MENKIGSLLITMLQENHELLQYMIMKFHKKVKFLFTGYKGYKTEMNLDEICLVIKHYVTSSRLKQLEENEWIVELKFEDVKKNV